VGRAADWQPLRIDGWARRAVDLWRLLECRSLSLAEAGRALNAEAAAAGGDAILLGYSLGGRLALHGLLAPGRPWRAAVIVSAHPGLEEEAERAARREHDAGWAARVLDDWEGFLAQWAAQPLLQGVEMTGRESLCRRRREIARGFVAWSLGAQQPLWGRLGEIEVPVLWVAGERDEKFAALARRAVALLPRGRLGLVAGAGHRVPWEAPERFARILAEFLEDADG
jgi:2-succinyl-6-hydroxy-2,4-cyclohexadiene-1-carboxylate synthase